MALSFQFAVGTGVLDGPLPQCFVADRPGGRSLQRACDKFKFTYKQEAEHPTGCSACYRLLSNTAPKDTVRRTVPLPNDRCQSAAVVVGIGNGVPILIGGRQDTTPVGAVIDSPLTSSVTAMPCHLPQRGRLRHSTVPCLMSYMSYKLLFERDKRTVPLSL